MEFYCLTDRWSSSSSILLAVEQLFQSRVLTKDLLSEQTMLILVVHIRINMDTHFSILLAVGSHEIIRGLDLFRFNRWEFIDFEYFGTCCLWGITPNEFSHCPEGENSEGGVMVIALIVEPNIVNTLLVP